MVGSGSRRRKIEEIIALLKCGLRGRTLVDY